jgi:hypothetical protein
MSDLHNWSNFYLLVGTAAGTLIGLQFVALTLFANHSHLTSAEANAAFSTPTIIHLSTVLIMSAAAQIPWQNSFGLTVSIFLLGCFGCIYVWLVIRRMRKQTTYIPVFQDWIFHAIFPLLIYVLMILSSLVVYCDTKNFLINIGVSTLVLLVISIHNSWDAVTYHVFSRRQIASD